MKIPMLSLAFKRSVLALFAVGAFSMFTVDIDPLDGIIKALEKYREEYPQEKLYLHFDKPYYAQGDLIWLKAYLVAGSYHQPSPLSQSIKIELIDTKNEIVASLKLKSDSGFARGSLQIPDSIQTGNYRVRAYTPWMTNFDRDYFFDQELRILGNGTPDENTDSVDTIDLQFFPEGGKMLAGLRNKIGFKVIGSDGRGREVEIIVKDDAGEQVTTVKSSLLGMGFFFLTPKEEKKYHAVIVSKPIKYNLPASEVNGFLIAATNKPESQEVVMRLQCTPSTVSKNQVYLVAHTRGVMTYAAKVDLSKNLFITKIPKSKLLSGITHLTLFDELNRPAAERLIYIDHADNLNISIKSSKEVYRPREKVEVSVHVIDSGGKGVQGNFSMAVIDSEKLIQPADDANILTHLLISSDLKGNIERAGYYFNPTHADRFEALDVLLLTQGWRRFTWEKMLKDQWPEILTPIDRGIPLSGKLLDNVSNKPIEGGKVIYIVTATGELQVQNTTTDGSFAFTDLIFYDSAKVTLQGENKRGNRTVKFKIDPEKNVPLQRRWFQSPFQRYSVTEAAYVKSIYEKRKYDAYTADGKSIELKAVEVSAKKIEEPAVEKMYGRSSKSLKMSDYPGTSTAIHPLQLLQGKMAGVQVTGSGFDYQVTIRGQGSIMAGNTPLIMVDNVPVDVSTLSSIRAQDIESIEVFKGPDAAVFGTQGANGAVLFYTKKNRTPISTQLGILNLNYGGYASAREFYSPKYDVPREEHQLPDNRSTIFWAPIIRTDSDGNAKIQFYNADQETKVSGIIQGISSFGKAGYSEFTYTVLKK
jgi:hypothetical protein